MPVETESWGQIMDLLTFRILGLPVVLLPFLAVVAFLWLKINKRHGIGRAPGEAVDPLQEAEVYLAYGRKKEAEEILTEAIKANPGRRKEFEAKLRELRGQPAPVNPVTRL